MTHFRLFANCLLVKGYNNSIITDLQRNNSHAVPNSMAEVIQYLHTGHSIADTIAYFGEENRTTVLEYISFLQEHELGFHLQADEIDRFPALDTGFQNPALATNSIVELSPRTIPYMEKIVRELRMAMCRHLQLIGYHNIDEQELLHVLAVCSRADFRSLELVLRYDEALLAVLNGAERTNFALLRITLHGAPFDSVDHTGSGTCELIHTTAGIDDFSNCGIVRLSEFTTNQKKVLESLHHNSCLHKKIAVDHKGDIKNCPAMPARFGNIAETSLLDALQSHEFKRPWSITKDQVHTCRDCEFRHICTDCRAFTEDPNDPLAKPLKCGYSPYTNLWEDWSSNPLKAQAMNYYKAKITGTAAESLSIS